MFAFLTLSAALFLVSGTSGVTAAIVPGQAGPSSTVQQLTDWCKNLTGQLTRTWNGFRNVDFNRTTALMNYSSSHVTELERLAYDKRDLKIYAFLFPQIHPNATIFGNQVVQCVQINHIMFGGLVATMEMTELYLNGTIPSLPQLQGAQSPSAVKKTRYQDINREIAQLKGLMGGAIGILGDMHVKNNPDSLA